MKSRWEEGRWMRREKEDRRRVGERWCAGGGAGRYGEMMQVDEKEEG